jgi:hypothetical protein
MALTAKLWTLSGLSTELGKNIKTLGRALSMTKPDGKIVGRDAWYLQTTIRAIERHECRNGSGGNICAELESLAVEIDEGLSLMRKEPDAKKRMVLAVAGSMIFWHRRVMTMTLFVYKR